MNEVNEASPANAESDLERLVRCEPFACATFNGEGSYDLRLYEDNESYRDEWIARNGERYKDWVMPLYREST